MFKINPLWAFFLEQNELSMNLGKNLRLISEFFCKKVLVSLLLEFCIWSKLRWTNFFCFFFDSFTSATVSARLDTITKVVSKLQDKFATNVQASSDASIDTSGTSATSATCAAKNESTAARQQVSRVARKNAATRAWTSEASTATPAKAQKLLWPCRMHLWKAVQTRHGISSLDSMDACNSPQQVTTRANKLPPTDKKDGISKNGPVVGKINNRGKVLASGELGKNRQSRASHIKVAAGRKSSRSGRGVMKSMNVARDCDKFNTRLIKTFKRFIHRDFFSQANANSASNGIVHGKPAKFPHTTDYYARYTQEFFDVSKPSGSF